MALNVVWTSRASSKFDKIIAYLNDEWGEKVTSSFVRKAYDFIDILIEFPEIGTMENKEKEIRGFTIAKQINIFYKIQENNITKVSLLISY